MYNHHTAVVFHMPYSLLFSMVNTSYIVVVVALIIVIAVVVLNIWKKFKKSSKLHYQTQLQLYTDSSCL